MEMEETEMEKDQAQQWKLVQGCSTELKNRRNRVPEKATFQEAMCPEADRGLVTSTAATTTLQQMTGDR